jgi:tetratricopeptide (TPR) repeat protein
MFQPWRLQLRAAEEALRQGRLDDASRLAAQGDLPEFLPAQKLLARIAGQFADRGYQRAVAGQTLAGWHDLEAADRLGADRRQIDKLRQQLIKAALTEAETYLAAGDPQAALERLEVLVERQPATREVRAMRELAQQLGRAQRFGRQGRFAEADDCLAAAAALRPDLKYIGQRRKVMEQQASECRRLSEELHTALGQEALTLSLSIADRWLAIAPECDAALAARRRAWAAVGAPLAAVAATQGQQGRPPAAPRDASRPPLMPVRGNTMKQPSSDVRLDESPSPRFLLWVDGVGGYLVCEDAEVVLGQPTDEGRVDVPILGDVSRRHATIRRDGEGYLITPRRPTRIDGRAIEGIAWLADGNLIELGDAVKLRFRRPHPLSATARLEFVSRHRTQPAADAVLLLADSLVLGPGASCHVPCRDWSRDVVLGRYGNDLFCRAPGAFQVDGASHAGQARLTRGSRVSGEDFSLTLENL